jgi:hypothetical protein
MRHAPDVSIDIAPQVHNCGWSPLQLNSHTLTLRFYLSFYINNHDKKKMLHQQLNNAFYDIIIIQYNISI